MLAWVAVIIGIASLIAAIFIMRHSYLNGHASLARHVVLSIALTAAVSALFIQLPHNLPAASWLRTVSRIERIYSPLILVAVIYTLRASRDDQRDRGGSERGPGDSGRHVRDRQSTQGDGEHLGLDGQAAA